MKLFMQLLRPHILMVAALLLGGSILVVNSTQAAPSEPPRLAGAGPVIVASFATTAPTIDGAIAPSEWGTPLQVTLNGFNNPSLTRSAELYLVNTSTELYIALALTDPTAADGDQAEINLDVNHDHTATAGREDALRYAGGPADLYWEGSDWTPDAAQHGAVTRTYAGGKYFYEFRKPLNSGDSQDLGVGAGATVGFRIQTWDATTSEYYRYPANTRGHGDVAVEWAKWADLSTAAPAAGEAPTLTAPENSAQLTSMTTTLTWTNPPLTTQAHVQVIPANNDGPGVNLILAEATSLQVPAPPDWYGLLPGMSYTWRVQSTTKTIFAPEDDPSWGPWSQSRTFRTPARDSSRIAVVSPASGITVGAEPQVLRWQNSDPDVFYYEVQVSPDAKFGEEGAVASVWHNLMHGGVSTPPNSWTSPALEAGVTYFWRVRPRIQGDGIPAQWSAAASFRTTGVLPTTTPTPTPTATATSTAIPTPSATATPAASSGYRIAFRSDRDGNSEVY